MDTGIWWRISKNASLSLENRGKASVLFVFTHLEMSVIHMCLSITSAGAFPVVAEARRLAVIFLSRFSREASTKRQSDIIGKTLSSI